MDEKKSYELMLLMVPSKPQAEIKKLLENIKKEITDRSGEITFEDIWGVRKLAYRIKGNREGFYAVFNFMLPPEKMRELEMFLRLERDVLRHLISLTPKEYHSITYNDLQKAEEELMSSKEKPRADEPVVKAAIATTHKKAAVKVSEDEEKQISAEIDKKLSKIIEQDMEL